MADTSFLGWKKEKMEAYKRSIGDLASKASPPLFPTVLPGAEKNIPANCLNMGAKILRIYAEKGKTLS